MGWQDDFDKAHADYLAQPSIEDELAGFATKAKAMLVTLESWGEEALPVLDGLVAILEAIPMPQTKIAGAALAGLLIGAHALKDQIMTPGGAA